jgi:hypothetical protein
MVWFPSERILLYHLSNFPHDCLLETRISILKCSNDPKPTTVRSVYTSIPSPSFGIQQFMACLWLDTGIGLVMGFKINYSALANSRTRVVVRREPDVSEEHITSIIKGDEWTKQETSNTQTASFCWFHAWLVFDPGDGCDVFPKRRVLSGLLSVTTCKDSTVHSHRFENTESNCLQGVSYCTKHRNDFHKTKQRNNTSLKTHRVAKLRKRERLLAVV